MWASRAVSVGYKWRVGNGRSIKFWEDVWFGSSPLATQFWDVYIISNQQTKTIAELWDGTVLRCDFRRTFTDELMTLWYEIVAIAESIALSAESNQLIWQYETNGVYSSKSMYTIVNFRGIQPVFLPSVWDIKVPPKLQVFLGCFPRIKC